MHQIMFELQHVFKDPFRENSFKLSPLLTSKIIKLLPSELDLSGRVQACEKEFTNKDLNSTL